MFQTTWQLAMLKKCLEEKAEGYLLSNRHMKKKKNSNGNILQNERKNKSLKKSNWEMRRI